MKHSTAALVAALLLYASPCAAQKQRPPRANDAPLMQGYDPAAQQTTVKVKPFDLTSDLDYAIAGNTSSPYVLRDSLFMMTAGFTYAGQKLVEPVREVTLGFLSLSRQRKLLGIKDVSALVDGTMLSLGQAAREDKNQTLGGVSEELSVVVPADVFLKIASGRDVRMKLGAKEFRLDKRHLARLRALAAAMNP